MTFLSVFCSPDLLLFLFVLFPDCVFAALCTLSDECFLLISPEGSGRVEGTNLFLPYFTSSFLNAPPEAYCHHFASTPPKSSSQWQKALSSTSGCRGGAAGGGALFLPPQFSWKSSSSVLASPLLPWQCPLPSCLVLVLPCSERWSKDVLVLTPSQTSLPPLLTAGHFGRAEREQFAQTPSDGREERTK